MPAQGSMQARSAMIGYGALVGVPFGFLLQKSGVLDPKVISKQLQLEDWRMMKTFLSALTSGLASVTLLHTMGEIEATARPLYPIATLSGGALIGFGMHLAGACPGTLLGQVVERREGVLWIALGALSGACAFGYAQPHLLQRTNVYVAGSSFTIFEHFGVEMWHVALPLLAILGTGLYVLEQYAPTLVVPSADGDAKNVSLRERVIEYLRAPRWHPYVCGALLGVMQVPALLLAKTAIGTSTAYVSAAAELRRLVDHAPNHYFSKHLLSSAKMVFKFVLDIGIMAGALVAGQSVALLSEKDQSKDEGHKESDEATEETPTQEKSGTKEEDEKSVAKKHVSPWGRYRTLIQNTKLFAGGFSLLFGARLADGCTSGHGLSGMAQLGLSSFFATAAMFGTGIVCAKFFNYDNSLEEDD
eukprot:TRINITY_DN11982_c0_g1_i1.p1 TRINITY_DN11982_c0_g1~~TRINITY_DN11982_c0_g1_i1.p1  ORF type:complete len:416 (+),score=112.65 TRINITY_DN11982_c0_g1_i1:138-1385(+)